MIAVLITKRAFDCSVDVGNCIVIIPLIAVRQTNGTYTVKFSAVPQSKFLIVFAFLTPIRRIILVPLVRVFEMVADIELFAGETQTEIF